MFSGLVSPSFGFSFVRVHTYVLGQQILTSLCTANRYDIQKRYDGKELKKFQKYIITDGTI